MRHVPPLTQNPTMSDDESKGGMKRTRDDDEAASGKRAPLDVRAVCVRAVAEKHARVLMHLSESTSVPLAS